jgi:hypothetical protein
MARDPDQRFASLRDLIASLDAIDPAPLTAATLPQISTPSSLRPIALPSSERALPDGRRTRQLLAVAAVASTLAAAAGFMLFERAPQAKQAPSASVRPRVVPPPVEPEPDLPAPAIPAGMLVPASAAQLELDAGADSGRVIPVPRVEPVKTVQPALPKPKPAVPLRPTPKPAAPEPAAIVVEPLPPTAAPTPQQAEAETEHNPLHMNIQ